MLSNRSRVILVRGVLVCSTSEERSALLLLSTSQAVVKFVGMRRRRHMTSQPKYNRTMPASAGNKMMQCMAAHYHPVQLLLLDRRGEEPFI